MIHVKSVVVSIGPLAWLGRQDHAGDAGRLSWARPCQARARQWRWASPAMIAGMPLVLLLATTSIVMAQDGSETPPMQLDLEIVDPATIGIGDEQETGASRIRDYEESQRQQEQEYQEIETFMETWGDGRLPPWERRGGL